jgi:hypothetical protein
MANAYHAIAFTHPVRETQSALGSRGHYARGEGGPVAGVRLGMEEAAFIAARDSFYMATVGASGWPYLQHRGGPPGFVRVLDEGTFGFADFRGNRQYVSVGNLATDDRAAFFFMDYANRARLKLFGRVTLIGPEPAGLLDRLTVPGYRARIERGFVVRVVAFDWNCSQHITPRFTEAEWRETMAAGRDT